MFIKMRKTILSLCMSLGIVMLLSACKGEAELEVDLGVLDFKMKVIWDGNNAGGNSGTKETLRESMYESGIKNASDIKIDLNSSNVSINTQNPEISVTLTSYGYPILTRVFDATLQYGRLSFTSPEEIDAWAEPYLDTATGITFESTQTYINREGINIVTADVYMGSTLIYRKTASKYITGGGNGDIPITLCDDPASCFVQ